MNMEFSKENRKRLQKILYNDAAKQWYMTWIVGYEWWIIIPVAVWVGTYNFWLGALTLIVGNFIKYLLRLWVIWGLAETMIMGVVLRAEKQRKDANKVKV